MVRQAIVATAAFASLLFAPLFFWSAPLFAQDDPLAAVRAAEKSRIEAIDAVYGSVVAIYGLNRQGGGSGVIFDPAGYALTNHHVIAGAGEAGWAGLADGELYRWRLMGTDPGGDVAIIKLEGREDFPASPLADSETVRVGDFAIAMGNPFLLAEDQRPTVTVGVVSGVHRFQPGEPGNLLIYGNCIQVDTSINPGNSGGPLFDMAGRIIGINGRCSFEERGRVNVGLGYAISSNQAKAFIPELMATKLARHGTLDAQFGTRQVGVVCQSINTSAPVAKAGLQLGDRIVSLEGVAIRTANEMTNLVSTFPEDWPVELVVDRGGKTKTFRVRLTPLPYGDGKKPPPKPKRPPKPEKEDDEGDEAEAPAPATQGEPFVEGKIRWLDRNQDAAKRWLARARAEVAAKSPGRIQIADKIVVAGAEVGQSVTRIDPAGKLRVDYKRDERTASFGFDGAKFWRKVGDAAAEEVDRNRWLQDPFAGQTLALAALLRDKSATSDPQGVATIEGSDKAARQPTGRLSLARDDKDESFYLWMGLTAIDGRARSLLTKSGFGRFDDEPTAATLYDDWKATTCGATLPARRTLVRGYAETVEAEVILVDATVDDSPAEVFSMEASK